MHRVKQTSHNTIRGQSERNHRNQSQGESNLLVVDAWVAFSDESGCAHVCDGELVIFFRKWARSQSSSFVAFFSHWFRQLLVDHPQKLRFFLIAPIWSLYNLLIEIAWVRFLSQSSTNGIAAVVVSEQKVRRVSHRWLLLRNLAAVNVDNLQLLWFSQDFGVKLIVKLLTGFALLLTSMSSWWPCSNIIE